MSDLGAAAAALAAIGWRVLPVHGLDHLGKCTCFAGEQCTAAGKHPAIKDWTERATADAARVARAWAANPSLNVGVATGAGSGLFVLDVDAGHGGFESLAGLIERFGPLPHTVAEDTGGGGLHAFFRFAPGMLNSAGRLGLGLDVRAEGGQVVVAPSRHRSGRRYAWRPGQSPHEAEVADAPPWLLALLLEDEPGRPRAAPKAAGDGYWRGLFEGGVSEGGRNVAATRLAGYLLRRRIDPYIVLDVVKLWSAARLTPPLPADEIEKLVDSVAGRELKRISKARKHRDGQPAGPGGGQV